MPSANPIIVLIDDSQNEHLVIQLAVQQLDVAATLVTAHDLVEGIQLVQQQDPEQVRVILLDVHLQSGDGRWAVTELARLAPRAIVVPYTADEAAGKQLHELGCFVPLLKPAAPNHIVRTLEQALAATPQRPSSPFYDFVKDQSARLLRIARQRRRPYASLLRRDLMWCFTGFVTLLNARVR